MYTYIKEKPRVTIVFSFERNKSAETDFKYIVLTFKLSYPPCHHTYIFIVTALLCFCSRSCASSHWPCRSRATMVCSCRQVRVISNQKKRKAAWAGNTFVKVWTCIFVLSIQGKSLGECVTEILSSRFLQIKLLISF